MDPAVVDVERFLSLDHRYRKILQEVEQMRARRNALSDKLAQSRPPQLLEEARQLKSELKDREEELEAVSKKRQKIWDVIPNRSAPEMPEGEGEADNVEILAWRPEGGYLPERHLGRDWKSAEAMPDRPVGVEKKFDLKDHLALGQELDLIDVEQSAIVSGSRFTYLKNEAVLLQYALGYYLARRLLKEGFTPMVPPLLVREEALYGTSHLPRGRDQIYQLESEFVEEQNELYLVGSSEPVLFAYYMDQCLEKGSLPKKLFALTTCFRSEAGSWGKDVRGIKRVHQFDKLEMDVVCTPEDSMQIMEELRAINEWFLQSLGLPYRIVNKCSGDCGYPATYKQYDVDVWLPSQGEYMEVMTNTNATDYQARRLNIRFRDTDGQLGYAHTVNDTGSAMGRMIIAILDNYQTPRGTVRVPPVLREFLDFEEITLPG